MPFPYTYDEFRDQLLRLQQANPDRTNPRVDGDGCAYTVPNGPDDGVEHCIIGEWLSIHDPDNLPDWDGYLNGSDSDPNYWAADRLFHELYGVSMSDPVARLAAHVQAQADGGQLRRSDVAWGEVDIPVVVP